MTNSFQPGIMNPASSAQARRPFNLEIVTGDPLAAFPVPPGWTSTTASLATTCNSGTNQAGHIVAQSGGTPAIGDLLLRSPFFQVQPGAPYRCVIYCGDLLAGVNSMELVLVNRAGAVVNTLESPMTPNTFHAVVQTFNMAAATPEVAVALRALVNVGQQPFIASGSFIERLSP